MLRSSRVFQPTFNPKEPVMHHPSTAARRSARKRSRRSAPRRSTPRISAARIRRMEAAFRQALVASRGTTDPIAYVTVTLAALAHPELMRQMVLRLTVVYSAFYLREQRASFAPNLGCE